MLRVVTGPFHPDLEDALVRDLRQTKQSDVLASLAVLVPSRPILHRLTQRLALDERLSMLNVHFLTFHQFALRLSAERSGGSEDARETDIAVRDDHFFRHLVGVVAAQHPDLQWRLPHGGWGALWATIRDLKDSAIDADAARQAVAEGVFDADDGPMLERLFELYGRVVDAARTLHVGGLDDVAARVTPLVDQSPFVRTLSRVFYYGFYDLTQVQLSLFEAVVRCADVTLYFPLSDDPACGFVRRFFDRHVTRLVPSTQAIVSTSDAARPLPQRQVMSAVGADDELVLACKTILSLVETHGYEFRDIAVVARTLDPYRHALARACSQHRVPYTTSATVPLLEQPAAKTLLQWAELRDSDFAAAVTLDVLTSPFFRRDRRTSGPNVSPERWRLAVYTAGVRKGEAHWRMLMQRDPDADVAMSPAQRQALCRAVLGLMDECRALPVDGSVAALTRAFRAWAGQHLTIPGLTTEDDVAEEQEPIARAVHEVFGRMEALDGLYPRIDWPAWGELFARTMESVTMPLPDDGVGVRVLDAMTARGLSFRAVIVLGMNEKVFPRFIREDAFLRDRHRRILDVTLGYKIDEKLAGYDEERLLFALLSAAARDRLYIVYQRADADGRPLAPSPYLAESFTPGIPPQVMHLPRRVSDRRDVPLCASPLLTPDEYGLRAILDGHDPAPLLEAMDRGPDLFVNGTRALQDLESSRRALNDYDGVVGETAGQWSRLMARGLAPTPLETFARCPFQYFAAQVLRLEPVRVPMSDAMAPQDLGELTHRLLRATAEALITEGWPEAKRGRAGLRLAVQPIAEAIFDRYAAAHPTGYPLLWTLARETIVRLVIESLVADEEAFDRSGYRPVAFEVEVDGHVPLPEASELLKVRGRLDRVDRGPDDRLKIIDYKVKYGRELKAEDKDLLTAAVRGARLQPPLYAQVAVDGTPPDHVEFRFLLPHAKAPIAQAVFHAREWSGPNGPQLHRTLMTLLEALRAGHYVMMPEDRHCNFCDMTAACRRYHGPSWWRGYISAPAAALRRLRKDTVARD